jgi:outer membrane protein TolC
MLCLGKLRFEQRGNPRAVARAMTAAASCLLLSVAVFAQEPAEPARREPVEQLDAPRAKVTAVAAAQAAASSAAPLQLTLADALNRARANSTAFQAAVTQSGVAAEDRNQARNAILPSVTYNNAALYTQTDHGIAVYIANNAGHEYISQANVHEAIDLASVYNWRRASAAAAVARAKAEIASRGLVVTVVQSYYAVAAAQEKLKTALHAADEGERFLKITNDLEHGGEVAHSDVIKADLQARERRRQLREAQLALLNTRLDLSVLIFPDFSDNFEVADDLHAVAPIPTLAEVEQQAARDNPDVRAAVASVAETGHGVTFARAGYFPALSFDYFYGIDADRFAANSVVSGTRISNLGSSALASVTIPVWNWGTTQSKVKQAELQKTQAQRELSYARRKLLAEIRSLYAEADTALNELSDLSRSAELSAESLRLVTLRYQNGESTVLEVVDAQNTYSAASNAFQDGAVRYRVSLANLQTLTGVLTTP